MWQKHQDKIYFILFVLQLTLVYKLIQLYFNHGYIWKNLLDDQIPLIAWFVVPYALYIVVLVFVFALALKSKKLFLATSKSYFWAVTVCNLFFVAVSTIIVRPQIISTGFFDNWILFIYSIDAPMNSFPSEHVAFTVLANLCLININKKIAYVIFPLTILIVLSTLFIKQHYIIDVAGGLVLALLCYEFVFKKSLAT